MERLKSICGPTAEEVWQKFGNQFNGKISFNGNKGHRIEFEYKCWKIIFDHYTIKVLDSSITYTIVRSKFINNHNFKFKLITKNNLNSIGQDLNLEKFTSENNHLNEKYIITTNNGNIMNEILNEDNIINIIDSQYNIYLEIRNYDKTCDMNSDQNISEIYFRKSGIIKDFQQLKDLYTLYCNLLDKLVDINITNILL